MALMAGYIYSLLTITKGHCHARPQGNGFSILHSLRCSLPCPVSHDSTYSLPLFSPAFKQSPQGIPALGTGIKKRRHGEEEMYYVPVSVGELQWGQKSAWDSGGIVPSARSTLGRGCQAVWGCTGSCRTARVLGIGAKASMDTHVQGIEASQTVPGHSDSQSRWKKGSMGNWNWTGETEIKQSPGLVPSSRCKAGRTLRS